MAPIWLNASSETNISRRFFQVSVDQGLSNPTVLCIAKDSFGFVWFGTQDGLNRYDGNECKIYRWERSGGLSLSYINHINEGPKGNLWISSHEGLFQFDRTSENFTLVIDPESEGGTTHNTLVNCSEFDEDGNLWVGSYKGLLRWNPTTKDSELFIPALPNSAGENEGQQSVRCFVLDGPNQVWVGSFDGLYVLDVPNHLFKKIDIQRLGLNTKEWSQVFHQRIDEKGILWASTQSNGLIAIDTQTRKGLDFNTSAINQQLSNVAIYGSTEDAQGRIWIATDHGLKCFDPDKNTLESFVSDPYSPFSLGEDIISSAPLIADNMLWLATRYSGVWMTDLDSSLFTPFTDIPGQGLNHSIVSNFAEDGKGNLLIATDGGGINQFDLETQEFAYFEEDDPPYYLPTNKILSILVDRKDRIWIGTWNEGLVRYDRKNGERRLYKPERGNSKSLGGLSVFYVLEDSNNQIWVATWEGGVSLYHEDTDNFTRYVHDPNKKETFVESPITHLMEDQEGGIWISSEIGGLNRLDPLTGKLELFKNHEGNPILNSNSINCTWEDPRGLIYIGTNGGGLNILDYQKRSVLKNSLVNILSHSTIYAIQQDKHGMVWLSTNDGLVRYDPVSGNIKHFTIEDGINDNRFGRWAASTLENGDLLFGGPEGFTWIDTDARSTKSSLPIPKITGIWTNETFFASRVDLSKTSEDKSSMFTSDVHALRFEFTAPAFRGSKRLKFQYRLIGIDDAWVKTEDIRVAQYRNLPHGKYVFQVQVAMGETDWQPELATFPFTIDTPIWLMWYSKLLALLVLLGIILLPIRWRVRSYRLRELELEKGIQERTRDLDQSHRQLTDQKAEIEKQNQRLQQLNHTKDKMLSIFAHDIKNPFNAVLGFADVLHTSYDELSEEERKEYIEFIRISSNDVYNLLDNLLYWSISQENKLPYRPESIFLNEAIEPALQLYEMIARQKNVSFVVNNFPKERPVLLDRQLIRMLIRNLINNAVKVTPEGGKIEVFCSQSKKEILFEIMDTGPGMPEDLNKKLLKGEGKSDGKISDAVSGTGLGLPLCIEIVHLHKGTIYVDPSYTDGCKICCSFPLSAGY